MGKLLFIEGALLLLCAGVSLIYKENDVYTFTLVAGITTLFGFILARLGKGAEKRFSRRDGYVIVSLAWIVFSIFGMLPYYISGYIPTITDAFFETMSGFTTTGASILDNIESLPHSFLFWRSMTQWIGGMGIVFFTIAVLPIFGTGGLQLFAAEATGITYDKVTPRIGVTAKWIWTIYIGLTVIETVFLYFGGMDLFDSICHSMTTTATGGYSTKQASIAYYNSPYIEYVISIFMFLSGINFSLLYLFFMKGKIKRFFQDSELKWYTMSVIIFTGITAIALFFTSALDPETSFRQAFFQVVSLHTTTGFATADYMTWIPFLWAMMGVIMLFGACGGSTTGAMKCIRLVILGKVTRNEFKRIIHPNAVLPVRINKHVVPPAAQSTVLSFAFLYIGLIFVGWLLMMALGVGFSESFGVVVSSIGNVGPGLGTLGPIYSWAAIPDLGKWFLSFLMLVGRLELFTVLLLFTPGFWKKR